MQSAKKQSYKGTFSRQKHCLSGHVYICMAKKYLDKTQQTKKDTHMRTYVYTYHVHIYIYNVTCTAYCVL